VDQLLVMEDWVAVDKEVEVKVMVKPIHVLV
jgi:hypothetical protein